MPRTHSLIKHLAQLSDPRIDRSKRHALGDILIISICALLCGAEGFAEMEEFGKAQRAWLGRWLELPRGIPSHDTFGRVFAALVPAQFAEAFTAWNSPAASSPSTTWAALKTIAREIHEADAGHVLALKANREVLHEEIGTLLDDALDHPLFASQAPPKKKARDQISL